MTRRRSKTGATPGRCDPELAHVWLPYAQMKTVSPPLPVARTQGVRIFLADGRELIDGMQENDNSRRSCRSTQMPSSRNVSFSAR